MRSRIHIKGHPLHPILVAFPIAFFIGTLIFDLLGFIQNNDSFWQTGYYLLLAGIAFTVLAAVPGIVDYFSVVPPKSSAKKRAAKHGIINVIMLLIFIGAWFYRNGGNESPLIILGAETVGVILLGISGWLGGTLVHRNQIGVDHRYAFAGKWKEKYFDDQESKIEVAELNELKVNQMMLVHVKDKRIVIGRTESGYVAFDDRCTHRGASLADGALICGVVQCPWHGSQFDCRTGDVTAGPADKNIPVYQLNEENGKLFLNV